MGEFASLKKESVTRYFLEMINSLLNPPEVMVLRTSARQYKNLQVGVSGLALLQKKHGRTLVGNGKSLVGTRRCSKSTTCCKRMEQNVSRLC